LNAPFSYNDNWDKRKEFVIRRRETLVLNQIRDYKIHSLLPAALFAVACLLTAPVVTAQEQSAQTKEVKTEVAQIKTVKSSDAAAAPLQPKWTGYKGVTIGMSADEVRAKLDHLKDKSKQEDFFVFSEMESAQVYYDDKGKVQAISINYVNDKSAPDAVAVLGEEIQAQADGSIYKLVRYPEAGYWVAYSRTAGDSPLVTVTIQQIR